MSNAKKVSASSALDALANAGALGLRPVDVPVKQDGKRLVLPAGEMTCGQYNLI